jgi:CTP synthase
VSLTKKRCVVFVVVNIFYLLLTALFSLSLALSLSHLTHAASDLGKPEETADMTLAEATAKHTAAWEMVNSCHGVFIAGGFGVRGVEGKIAAAKYCRENKKPCLGVCLGFQVMVIEWCRNVMSLEGANSAEFDEECEPKAVVFMPEIDKENLGGTMRLGSRDTLMTHTFKNGEQSTASFLYGKRDRVSERHRHRYEVNPEMASTIEDSGLTFTGRDETGTRMEISELPRSEHPYYVGCQYHPEFQSRPLRPSPPFLGLLLAASGRLEEALEGTKFN